jgi:hypothetical protein
MFLQKDIFPYIFRCFAPLGNLQTDRNRTTQQNNRQPLLVISQWLRINGDFSPNITRQVYEILAEGNILCIFAPLSSLECKSVVSEDTENRRSFQVELQCHTSYTIEFPSFHRKRFTIDHSQLFSKPL